MITQKIQGTWEDFHGLFSVEKNRQWVLYNLTSNDVFVVISESATPPSLFANIMDNRTGIMIKAGELGVIPSTTNNVFIYGNGTVTVDSLLGGSLPTTKADLPDDVWTSDKEKFRRLRVDVGQTGLFEGREFRMVRKLIIPAATPRVFKFHSTVDFILMEQSLSAAAGDIEYYAYTEDDGVESGSFSTNVMTISKNRSAFYRDYDGGRYVSNVTITTGGDFTPTNPEVYVDYDRAKTSGATVQQISVRGGDDTVRYLPAGTYYLKLSSLSGTSEGRFAIAWEERP